MATALFEPQTASFGRLVIYPRHRRQPDFARATLVVEDPAARNTRNNLFITIGFVTAFITFLSGLYVVNSAMFSHGYSHGPTTATASVDYD